MCKALVKSSPPTNRYPVISSFLIDSICFDVTFDYIFVIICCLFRSVLRDDSAEDSPWLSGPLHSPDRSVRVYPVM